MIPVLVSPERATNQQTWAHAHADAAVGPNHPQAPQTPELASRSSRTMRNDVDDDVDARSSVRVAPAPPVFLDPHACHGATTGTLHSVWAVKSLTETLLCTCPCRCTIGRAIS